MTAVAFCLIILLMVQQGFWMIMSQNLINKLMSRNYADYLQAQAAVMPSDKKPAAEVAPEPNPDLGSLSELIT